MGVGLAWASLVRNRFSESPGPRATKHGSVGPERSAASTWPYGSLGLTYWALGISHKGPRRPNIARRPRKGVWPRAKTGRWFSILGLGFTP